MLNPNIFLLAVGLSVLACRAYTYQGLFNVLVSFVSPFGEIVRFLLTFPFVGPFVRLAGLASTRGICLLLVAVGCLEFPTRISYCKDSDFLTLAEELGANCEETLVLLLRLDVRLHGAVRLHEFNHLAVVRLLGVDESDLVVFHIVPFNITKIMHSPVAFRCLALAGQPRVAPVPY